MYVFKGHNFAITILKYITKERQDKNYKCQQIVHIGHLYIICKLIHMCVY